MREKEARAGSKYRWVQLTCGHEHLARAKLEVSCHLCLQLFESMVPVLNKGDRVVTVDVPVIRGVVVGYGRDPEYIRVRRDGMVNPERYHRSELTKERP